MDGSRVSHSVRSKLCQHCQNIEDQKNIRNAMSSPRSRYIVHAEVHRTESDSTPVDEAKAGYPLERRLNRLERVTAAFRGRIELRFGNGVLSTFDTADAAFLGACEMQHRCAVLPQVSGYKLALRVGVHRGLIRQRSRDTLDNGREIASFLAILDDGIAISDLTLAEVNTDLRKIARPMPEASVLVGVAAHAVDWRAEVGTVAYGGESFWPSHMEPPPASPYLVLHHGLRTLELSEENPTLTIGRDPKSDLIVNDSHVSRNHCRIERHPDRIVLTDSSTNGTCVKPDNGESFLVKNNSVVLKSKGILLFGRPFTGERRGGARFETQ
ncbi:FHA domain-containing protein [Propionivibrio soli]|uniref:FHA domain-containing protein n=1 Tax=Propionivibrio soli TaxID=2976531 RepID=UPI0021E869AE|nr:FHA domain-containing protein [Propionivibrio soli]